MWGPAALNVCCVLVVLQKKKELGKPESQKCVWIIDCWYGHIDLSFRQWVREQYPWLLVLYIPAACTSKLQPCDLVLNKTIKAAAAEAFAEDLAEGLSTFVGDVEEKARFIQVMLSTSVLKPLLPLYLLAGVTAAAAENPDAIKAAWNKAGWLRAWEKKYQVSMALLGI